jgi:hypothetical protein
MTAQQRRGVYLLTGLLWLSGCVWLGMDQWPSHRDPFAGERNAWQPALLTAHGIMAIASMYLIGWISSHHVVRWWVIKRRRWSGGLLAGATAVLILSGFALFFVSDDRWQRYAAGVHDVLGVSFTVLAIQHWFNFKRTAR